MKREEAARFSFLLGSIAIAGAGLLKALHFEEFQVAPQILFAGFLSSFLSGLVVMSWLMKYIKTHSLTVFGIYRVIIGAVLILWL